MTPLDNAAVARVLAEVADLLEVAQENAFKVRAYRSAADLVRHAGERVADLDEVALRSWPGVGKDLAARIREIVTTGTCITHHELSQRFPATLLGLLRLRGLGPKTVSLLYTQLGLASVEALGNALADGRVGQLKGMGPKKQAQMQQAVDEYRQNAGRHRLVDATALMTTLVAWLRAQLPEVEFTPVGSVRRGTETCGDLDVLAIGGHPDAVWSVAERLPGFVRVLERGEHHVRVSVDPGYAVDVHHAPPERRGLALLRLTGSAAHVTAVQALAAARGLRLDGAGDAPADNESVVPFVDDAAVYAAVGLPWIAPELREDRGEVAAAQAGTLPILIARDDLRGDLHMHTTETDGKDDLAAMVAAARAAGHEYIAITDHSKALAMANGLDEARALDHAARIRAVSAQFTDITVLAGIECDILADGRMDLDDACLAQLDLVIGSVHSALQQDAGEITARLLRAIECPWLDIIGHPTGRLLLRRDASKVDVERVATAAAARGVALEINCLPDRLDLSDVHARLARDRGASIVISTDAHSAAALARLRWGVINARRAWLAKGDVMNSQPLAGLLRGLRRSRSRAASGG